MAPKKQTATQRKANYKMRKDSAKVMQKQYEASGTKARVQKGTSPGTKVTRTSLPKVGGVVRTPKPKPAAARPSVGIPSSVKSAIRSSTQTIRSVTNSPAAKAVGSAATKAVSRGAGRYVRPAAAVFGAYSAATAAKDAWDEMKRRQAKGSK